MARLKITINSQIADEFSKFYTSKYLCWMRFKFFYKNFALQQYPAIVYSNTESIEKLYHTEFWLVLSITF